MKIVLMEYKVYEFEELSPEARKNAIDKWYEHEDYCYLEDELTECCKSLLEENNIVLKENLKLGYSLSYSQGDGLNFTGNFYWKKYDIRIKHSWRYQFASSSVIVIYNNRGEELPENHVDYEKFKKLYLNICNELEKYGYAELEYRMNDDEFSHHCEINEYTFSENGELFNK